MSYKDINASLLLTLVPEVPEVEKEKMRSFWVYSIPGDNTTTRYDFLITQLDGTGPRVYVLSSTGHCKRRNSAWQATTWIRIPCQLGTTLLKARTNSTLSGSKMFFGQPLVKQPMLPPFGAANALGDNKMTEIIQYDAVQLGVVPLPLGIKNLEVHFSR